MSSSRDLRTTIDCPRCGQSVPADQEWCLRCGAAARTRLAAVPRWRIPVAVLATLLALSLAAVVVAFLDLTNDPERPLVVSVPTITTIPAPQPGPTTTTP